MHVRLHHHREQSLVDTAAPLQQRREERPLPQLRDPQIQRPAVVVSLRGRVPLRCVTGSSERSNGAAPMNAVASASISSWWSFCVADWNRSETSVCWIPEELEEGRLVKSHRALCLSLSSFSRFSLTIARWLTHVYDADKPVRISTTPGDVTAKLHTNSSSPGDSPNSAGATRGAGDERFNRLRRSLGNAPERLPDPWAYRGHRDFNNFAALSKFI